MAILLSLSEEVMREPVSEHRMVVVLLWVWAAAVARPLVAEQNLMENGGFERGEPGQLPLPWRLETGKNTRNVTVTLDETNPFAGRRALRLDTRPRDAVEAGKAIPSLTLKSAIPVKPGGVYTLSCRIRAETMGVKGRLMVMDSWDTPQPFFLAFRSKEAGFDTEWQEYSLTAKAPREGDDKFLAERKGLFVRIDVLTDGVVWVDEVSFRQTEGTFLNEGDKVQGRWRHIQWGDLIAEFTGTGVGPVWLKGGCPVSQDFCFTSGDRTYRASNAKEPVWGEVSYEMKYAPLDALAADGDEARAMRIRGTAQGLNLDYTVAFAEPYCLRMDVQARAARPDIKDFCWKLNLGNYRGTPPDSVLAVLEGDVRRSYSLKGNVPPLEVSRWLGFTVAQNWTVDVHLDAIGKAYVTGADLLVYPEGLAKGAALEKDRAYRMSFRVKVREVPFYEGPIQVSHKPTSPLFTFPEPIALQVTLPEGWASLQATLFDALADKPLQGDRLSPPTAKDGKATYQWTYTPPQPGVYELRLATKDRQGNECRRMCELVSVGRIPQRRIPANTPEKDAFELQLVDQIDCIDPSDPHPFLDGVTPSAIVDSALGKYREAGSRHADCLIWEFRVKDLGQPHLVVVEYPDDKPRTMSFCVTEPESIPRVSNGVICGYPYPPTKSFQEVSTLYYPAKPTAYFVILTCEEGHPAAVRRVSIYRILNDIPEIVVHNQAPGRFIGLHTESENTQWTSYCSKTRTKLWRAGTFEWTDMKSDYFYREWYRTLANHIKDMRYSGQNLFVTGAYRYSMGLYPACSEIYTKYGAHALDYFELMARMFEANDLGLILSVEFLNTPRTIASLRRCSYGEMLKGGRCLAQVSRTGQVASMFGHPVLNPFAPEVQNALVKIADELAGNYGKFRSVLGVAFLCGDEGFQPCLFRRFVPGEDNLEFSYDDISVARFEREAGIRVPVDRTAPDRFAKRYEWLMANAKDAWIQWRCQAMKELMLKIHEKVSSRGQRCYFLDMRSVMDTFSERRWRTVGVPYRDLLRERGFDPHLFRGVPGLVFGNFYKQNEGRYYVHRAALLTSKHTPTNGVIREFNAAQDVRDAYSSGLDTACFIHNQFYEVYFPFGKERRWRELTIPNHWTGTDYSWPTRPYFSDPFTAMLSSGDMPRVLMHTFADNESWVGSQDQMRKFALAFRTLPLAGYRTLEGERFDGNVIIRLARVQDDTFLCVLNPCWWSADCTLTFSKPAKMVELVTDVVCEADDGSARLALGPYDLRTFRLTGNVAVTAAETAVSHAGIAELKSRIGLFEDTLGRIKASEPPQGLLTALEEIRRAKDCLAAKQFRRALGHVDGFRLRDAMESLRKQAQ